MNTVDVRQTFQGGFTEYRVATRYIVVHHAAATYAPLKGIDDVRAIANYHVKTKGWSGIGYHRVLAEETNGNPPAQYIVSDPDLIRAHVAYRNHEAVGVCCATFFTGQPSLDWMNSLAAAVAELQQMYPQAEIVGHREIALPGWGTSCPGDAWPTWRPHLLALVHHRLKAIRPMVTENHPTLGATGITFDQAFRFLDGHPHGEYRKGALVEILTAYQRISEQVGADFGVCVAQLIHETDNLASFWASRPYRNPAGIGVTGDYALNTPDNLDGWVFNTQRNRWERGLSFPTWANHAVPAHIARLLAYALAPEARTPTQQAFIETNTKARPLPAACHGTAPTLKQLGHAHNPCSACGWAWEGTDYGARLANQIRLLQAV